MVDAGISRPDGEHQALDTILKHLAKGGRLWLFLDYDGTLVPYALTPDQAVPDAELLDLLARIGNNSRLRTVILSGRPLISLQKWLPIPGILLAGLYGVEIEMPGQGITRRVDPAGVRKIVEDVKAAWGQLIYGRSGYLVEDKGMSVALHSRLADPSEAGEILPQAQAVLSDKAGAEFRVMGGDRFLEIAPSVAHKGEAVDWLMHHVELADALPVYFGDDDKDEEAYAVIRRHGGIPIIVGPREPNSLALVRLADPFQARRWLKQILEAAN